MNFIYRALAVVALVVAPIVAMSQNFEPLDGRFMSDPDNFVDPALVDSRDLGTLPDGMGQLKYILPVHEAEPATQYGGWGGMRFIERTINGKKWLYQDYLNPYIYYIISELPSGARYYGLYTSGYDKIEDVAAGKQSSHPFTACYAVYGTLVNPDGSEEKVVQYLDSQWKKLAVAKPSGTYYMHNYYAFEALEITFNPGGVGKVVAHLPRTYHQAPQEFGGSQTERYKNGRVKKVHRQLRGGYHFYMDGSATTNMKWSLKDGKLDITLTSKPTFSTKGAIDFDRSFANMEISASDRRIEEGKYRQDFPTNDYVVEAKENKKQTLESEYRGHDLSLPVLHLAKNEILLDIKSDNRVGHFYWVLDRQRDIDGILSYCYNNLSKLVQTYAERREYGVKKQYEFFCRNTPMGIASSIPVLANNQGYVVSDINPVDRTAMIGFISGGKEYEAKMQFDAKWHLDNSLVQSSLKEIDEITPVNEKISADNAHILEYKKDKRRSKIVKNYEKEAKRITIPASYANLDEYFALRKKQEQMIKLQEETLKALE